MMPRSKRPSGTAPTIHVAADERCRATSSIAADGSTPVTSKPRSARSAVTIPVPQPNSRIVRAPSSDASAA
jgi:hypothetical protein